MAAELIASTPSGQDGGRALAAEAHRALLASQQWHPGGGELQCFAMNPHQILEHLRRQPFRPLRIHVSDGSSYDVAHPEMALVTRTEVAIALELAGDDLPSA